MKMAENYFTLLGLPLRFQLSLSDLEERYRRLSEQWHPDRQASMNASDRTHILLRAADLNQAYQTMRDDLKRASYLLELYKTKFGQAQTDSSFSEDPDFLKSVLEWQEAIEEARALHDEEKMQYLSQEALLGIGNVKQELTSLFERMEQGEQDLIPAVERYLSRFRFYQRLEANLSSEESRL